MNSEDIYSSLKGVTEAIQNFSVRSQEDMNEPVQRREGEEVSGRRLEDEWCVCLLMPAGLFVCTKADGELCHATAVKYHCL